MALVKVGTGGMPIPDKIQFARQVVTDMTGNPNFTTPAPTLPNITTAATALETAYNAAQAARQVAKSLTTIQDQKSAALDLILAQEGNYVENTSGGDTAKIESSGFAVKARSTPIGVLPAPVVTSITPSQNPGTVDMKWGKVRGAKTYNIDRAPDSTGELAWASAAVATKTKATVNSMTSGARYWFRIAGVGAAGQGDWSDPISKIAP